MAGHLIAQRGQQLSSGCAEPEKGPQFKSTGIEQHPDDAARWLGGKVEVDRDLTGLGTSMARLELHVTHHAVAFQHQIVAAAIDFGPKDLNVTCSPLPQHAEKLTHEDVLDQLFAQT